MIRLGLTNLLLVACSSFLLDKVSAERNIVSTDDEVTLPDGRKAQVSVTSDEDCKFKKESTTLDDGSTSDILKDFEEGQSSLLLSKQPDVCYIRDIPQGELSSHRRRCIHGQVFVKPDSSLPGARTYVEGNSLNATDLSDVLAEFCGDRRIVELVVAVSPPSSGGRKRCLETIVRVCQNVLCCCHDVCVKYGWLFRANKCVRTENQCGTSEKCENKIEKVGCS